MKNIKLKYFFIISLFILITIIPSINKVYGESNTKLQEGKYVIYGKYQGKPILWRVIKIDENGNPFLWSEYAICAKIMSGVSPTSKTYEDHKDAYYWKGSNLRQWLNSDEIQIAWWSDAPSKDNINYEREKKYAYDAEPGFLTNFSDWEKSLLVPTKRKIVLHSKFNVTPEGGTENFNPEIGETAITADKALANFDSSYYITTEDKVFLLNISELKNDVQDKNVSLVKDTAVSFTNVPEANVNWAEHAMYWLDTHVFDSLMMVNSDGNVTNEYGFLWIDSLSGVCPAVVISKNKINITSGYGSRNSPYILGNQSTIKNNENQKTTKIVADSWAEESVKWAIENGILNDNEIPKIKKQVTRVEAAALCLRFYEYLGGKQIETPHIKAFLDTNNVEAEKAYALGLVDSRGDGKFEPNGKVSREQLCGMLYDTLQKINSSLDDERKKIKYKDKDSISYNYIHAVEFLATYKVISDSNLFSPKSNATIQQVALMMKNIEKVYSNMPTIEFKENRIIKQGTAGNKVWRIIEQLKQWEEESKNSPSLINEEYYSEKVTKLIKEFQNQNNLVVSGNVDFNTWKKLNYDICWGVPHKEVNFKDKNLENYLKELLGVTTGALYEDDLSFISTLTIPQGKSIHLLNGLEKMVGLTELCISTPEIVDYTPLKELKNMTKFQISSCKIKNLSILENMMHLSNLSLNDCGISDISALGKMKNLTSLDLQGNQISDISPLSDLDLINLTLESNNISLLPKIKCLKNILYLNLNNNRITNIDNLKFCEKLSYLNLENNQISDFKSISKIKSLTKIWIKNTGVSDLTFLSNCKNVMLIEAQDNKITNVDCLAQLKKLEYLTISNNQISNINSLKDLTLLCYLELKSNPIKDLSPIANMKRLYSLSADLMCDDVYWAMELKNLNSVSFEKVDLFKFDLVYPSLKELAKKDYITYANVTLLDKSYDTQYNLSLDKEHLLNDGYVNSLKNQINCFIKTTGEILENINKPGLSDYDKVKFVYDWLVNNVSYDYDYFGSGIITQDNCTCFGVLSVEERLAICQGFSVTAEYLLKKAGIDIITVTGIASGSTDYRGISRQGHAWNIVKIDDKYYQMDVTWSNIPGCFLVSDDTIQSKGDREWDVTKYPKCESDY